MSCKTFSHLVMLCSLLAVSSLGTGCQKASYPEEKIVSSIQEICRKEYGVEHVEVKIVGKTLGVFLPLKKLFMMDVRHLVISGQLDNLESLFEPDPTAMDQLENVLFAISRVMLSTDKGLLFYVLRAADVQETGLELVLTGYIPDVSRVRLWDIPRSEYRKRVIHELKLNQAILWERPVRNLLQNMGTVDRGELANRYFLVQPTRETVSPFFYDEMTSAKEKENLQYDLLSIKSHPYTDLKALVYVKVRETYRRKRDASLQRTYPYSSGSEFEYIFVVEPAEKEFKIVQVISFQYVDEMNLLRKTDFPKELKMDERVDLWSERFDVEDLTLGVFLARQLNRRVQAELVVDERVRLTIKHARINFQFGESEMEGSPDRQHQSFEIHFDFVSKDMKRPPRALKDVLGDEDVLYIFELLMKEFVTVLRSYQFSDFEDLSLQWEPEGYGGAQDVIDKDHIELFRQGKIGIRDLLHLSP